MALPNVQPIVSFGAGIGFTLLAWGLLHFNQRRVRRDRFRRAVLLEATRVGEAATALLEDIDDVAGLEQVDLDETLVAISSDILDGDPVRMSMLTTAEIRAVAEFYESSQLLCRELERNRADDSVDPDRLRRYAERTVDHSDRVQTTVFRSRLSRLTEWSKRQDRSLRS